MAKRSMMVPKTLKTGETVKVKYEDLSTFEKGNVKKQKVKEIAKYKFQHCRMCDTLLNYDDFYDTTTPHLDKNGKMSICKRCINTLIKEKYDVYGDYYKTFFSLCKDIDLRYDEGLVAETCAYMQKEPKINDTYFSKYMKLLKTIPSDNGIRFSNTELEIKFQDLQDNKTSFNKKDMKIKWGDFTEADYAFLEEKYNEYITSYGASTPSEMDTFKTLVLLLLRQRTDPANKDVTAALKSQYELIGINPKAMRQENKDKGKMIIGIEAELIERTQPAEIYDDPALYFDHDKLDRDIKDIKRAIKNHLTGSRDFESEGVDLTEVFAKTSDGDDEE